MVYLKINDIRIEFKAKFTPLNFHYNIYDSGINNQSGNLILSQLIISKNDYEYLKEIEIQTLILQNNTHYLNLSEKSIIINKCLNKEDENNYTITISIRYDNVFDFYDYFYGEIHNFFKTPYSSYDCLSTGNVCNLKCPYCTQGEIHIKPEFKMNLDYILYHDKIKKIIEINQKHGVTVNKSRLMGGETFYNFDSFKRSFNELISLNDENIDDLWIYTNYTMNVDKFLDYIEYMLTKVKHITLVITSDSLDYNKSLRISDKKTMEKYINNIKETCERYSTDSRVTIATNNMFITEEESLKTVKSLYNMGINLIQLAYNEFSNINDGNNIRFKLSNIFETLEKDNIPRLKPNLGSVVWLHFSVCEGEVEIYRSKLSLFSTEYKPSVLNDY